MRFQIKYYKSILLFAIMLTSGLQSSNLYAQAPVNPVPSEAQLAWQQLEYYAFVHFNMNTFSDMEWGTGGESPSQFNPTQLDATQWVKVFKEAGMKAVILTAKHHDGFCLWPTKTTEHSVKNSPWKNGQGDVVKELSEACKEAGLKFGIYLSPWDRNNAVYGTPAYIPIFRGQLRELLTNYGDIFEVWFDGANGGTGYYGGTNERRNIESKTYYGWEETWALVKELQPNAMIFGDGGPDVRWVGNEAGWANKTNWSLLRRDEVYPGWPRYVELRSGHEDGTHWVPAEIDVSIRPGWYYHKSENDKVKKLPRLLDIYYESVGRNGSLLLNVPADARGLINQKDVQALQLLRKALDSDFENDLATGNMVEDSNYRTDSEEFAPANVNDANHETYWATDDGVTDASLIIDFKEPIRFNRFLIQEYIRLGQRVKQFTVEAEVNGNWKVIATETTIGYKRILRLPATKTSKIKLHIKDAKASPLISNIEVYFAPKLLIAPTITRTKSGEVKITPPDTGLDIFYTFDGTVPTKNSISYTKPFFQKEKAVLKAICYNTGSRSIVAQSNLDVCKEKWLVVSPKGKKHKSEAVIDEGGKSSWNFRNKNLPVELIIDLGETLEIKGFTYLPDQGKRASGYISQYEFYVSSDKINWGEPVSKGEFSNIKSNPIQQQKNFEVKKGRFIMLKAIDTAQNDNQVRVAEIGIITK